MSILDHPLHVLNHTEKDLISDVEKYTDKVLLKIKYLEEIILSIYDFKNYYFDEKNNKTILHNRTLTPKVFERQHKIARRRLKSLLKESLLQTYDLEHVKSKYAQFQDFFQMHILSLEESLPTIHRIVELQISVMKNILEHFNHFVVDPDLWIVVYERAQKQYKGRTLYEDTLAAKDKIFLEWQNNVQRIEQLKQLIAKEISIIIEKDISDKSISNMRVEASRHIRAGSMTTEMRHLLKDSENMLALERERHMHVFHATPGPQPVPLNEHNYPGGFYVCTDRWQYAQLIKANQTTDNGRSLNVYDIDIPISLFQKLFLRDNQAGAENMSSEEAYDHAYFLPVSKYVELNHFMQLHICESSLLKKAA